MRLSIDSFSSIFSDAMGKFTGDIPAGEFANRI